MRRTQTPDPRPAGRHCRRNPVPGNDSCHGGSGRRAFGVGGFENSGALLWGLGKASSGLRRDVTRAYVNRSILNPLGPKPKWWDLRVSGGGTARAPRTPTNFGSSFRCELGSLTARLPLRLRPRCTFRSASTPGVKCVGLPGLWSSRGFRLNLGFRLNSLPASSRAPCSTEVWACRRDLP